MNAALQMRWQVRASRGSSNLAVFPVRTVVVVEGVNHTKGTRQTEKTAGVGWIRQSVSALCRTVRVRLSPTVLHQALRGCAEARRQQERARRVISWQV